MSIKINEIKVDLAGPLINLNIKPGKITLFYGKNESGKTYLVELLIRSLFSVKNYDGDLREQETSGQVFISGIPDQDKPIKLNQKSKRKLEQLVHVLDGENNLPSSISRLLVVRAGELAVGKGNSIGVNRSFLLPYLSNQNFLNIIQKQISTTIQNAKFDLLTGALTGSNQGEFKTRNNLEDQIKRIGNIRERIRKLYSEGVRAGWRVNLLQIDQELALLEQAKRYNAWQINQRILGYRDQLSAIPQEDINQLFTRISLYMEKNRERLNKHNKLILDSRQCKDYPWLEQTIPIFENCIAQGTSQPSPTFLLLTIAAFILAVVLSLCNMPIPCIVFSLIGVVFGILYSNKIRASWKISGYRKEIEIINKEYLVRFGHPLSGLSILKSQENALKNIYYGTQNLRKDLETLTENLSLLADQINNEFSNLGYVETKIENWSDQLNRLKNKRTNIENQIQTEEHDLNDLHVHVSDYLETNPECIFSQDQVNQLIHEKEILQDNLTNEENELKRLRSSIADETHQDVTADWEFLIHELEKLHKNTVQEYRDLCAKMIAGYVVSDVINDFRKQEELLIARALNTPQTNYLLQNLTGHYQKVELDQDILMVSDGNLEYPLSELSTGTQEQVMLSLRVAIATQAFNGQPAFLILDDAFQHSDWSRRENLIDAVMKLADDGWQIMYFTMDDHIRGLFQDKIAPILKNDYKYVDLTLN